MELALPETSKLKTPLSTEDSASWASRESGEAKDRKKDSADSATDTLKGMSVMKPTHDKSPPKLPSDNLVPLEAVLCTEELNRRPSRPPDSETENRALVELALALADSPPTILQTLAEKVLEVLYAGSAGISLLTGDEER